MDSKIPVDLKIPADSKILLDAKTKEQLEQWNKSLSKREKDLHVLASSMLHKSFVIPNDTKDNGSYFPEKSHSFTSWLKKQGT